MVGGLDAGKYFWRSGREKCFSLDIPFYRTSGRNESVPGRDFHPQWTSAFSRRTRDQFDRKFTIKGETKFTTKKQRLYGNSTG